MLLGLVSFRLAFCLLVAQQFAQALDNVGQLDHLQRGLVAPAVGSVTVLVVLDGQPLLLCSLNHSVNAA